MAKRPSTPEPTPFETELAEFFGETLAGGAAIRDHVTFRPAGGASVEPLEAAEDFARHVKAAAKARSERAKIRAHTAYSGAVTVRVAWSGDRFHTIKFAEAPDGRLLARHRVAGAQYLSTMLYEWLTATDRFTDISWRTEAQFHAGEPGQAFTGVAPALRLPVRELLNRTATVTVASSSPSRARARKRIWRASPTWRPAAAARGGGLVAGVLDRIAGRRVPDLRIDPVRPGRRPGSWRSGG